MAVRIEECVLCGACFDGIGVGGVFWNPGTGDIIFNGCDGQPQVAHGLECKNVTHVQEAAATEYLTNLRSGDASIIGYFYAEGGMMICHGQGIAKHYVGSTAQGPVAQYKFEFYDVD